MLGCHTGTPTSAKNPDNSAVKAQGQRPETQPKSGPLERARSEAYVAKLDATHPLVGTIWDVARGSKIDLAEVQTKLTNADVILLGEKHDHPDHHRLQAAFVEQIASAHPAVSFEMIDVDEQAIIDRVLGAPGSATTLDLAGQRADALSEEITWKKRGWPAWSMYRPVFVAALMGGGAVRGANYPKAATKAIMRGGEIDATTSHRLGLDRPLPTTEQQALDEEMRTSHCGHLPETMLAPMGTAQRARDGQMAEVVAQSLASGSKAVLIAGAGHVRRDRGVPFVLAASHPTKRTLSIAFIEVASGANTLADYGSRYAAKALPFDIVWFTPRLDDDDPCEAFRKK